MVSCLTIGVGVPSGLFVPSIVIGAGWGRFVGTVLMSRYPETLWADPGKYALIGSAAFLGGVRLCCSVLCFVCNLFAGKMVAVSEPHGICTPWKVACVRGVVQRDRLSVVSLPYNTRRL